MHRQDRFRSGGDGSFNQRWLEIKRSILDINEHGFRSDIGNRPTGRHESKWGRDHFISWTNIQKQHSHVKSRSAAVKADAILFPNVSRKIVFKPRHVGPQAESAMVQGASNGGIDLFANPAHLL